MAVKGMRSRCNAFKSKSCFGNKNVKVRLYSLSLDSYQMYLFSVTEKQTNGPEL